MKDDIYPIWRDVDGYLRIYFKNINRVWYDVIIAPEEKGSHMWITDPKSEVFIHTLSVSASSFLWWFTNVFIF